MMLHFSDLHEGNSPVFFKSDTSGDIFARHDILLTKRRIENFTRSAAITIISNPNYPFLILNTIWVGNRFPIIQH